MGATIVTALYDIGREKVDGRGMSQYYEWFAKTLQLKCPMVIYCDEITRPFIESNRKLSETKVICKKLEEVPYFHLKDKMDAVLSSESYKSKVKDPDRIECKISLYNIVQYCKFPWLLHAAQENYFGTDYFIWMDAGFSRLVSDFQFDTTFPGENFMQQIASFPERVLFQAYQYPYDDLFNAANISEDYFYDNRSYVMGGLFGSDRRGIEKVCKSVDDLLEKQMLDNGVVANDQIGIGFLLKKNNEDFVVLQNNPRVRNNFELFYQMSF